MNPRYLLDTSVFSQPLRDQPVMACLERWQDSGDAACPICAATIAEVEFSLHLEYLPEHWKKYQGLLDGRLEVLPTDAAVWSEFANRKARQQQLGRVVSDLDPLIASCAILHSL
jgi:predicted nucleic acid-binding protein